MSGIWKNLKYPIHSWEFLQISYLKYGSMPLKSIIMIWTVRNELFSKKSAYDFPFHIVKCMYYLNDTRSPDSRVLAIQFKGANLTIVKKWKSLLHVLEVLFICSHITWLVSSFISTHFISPKTQCLFIRYQFYVSCFSVVDNFIRMASKIINQYLFIFQRPQTNDFGVSDQRV